MAMNAQMDGTGQGTEISDCWVFSLKLNIRITPSKAQATL